MYSETRHGGVIDDAGRVQKLTGLQIFVLVMCVFINALDGYDVLAIAFSAPALSREWSLSPTELGSLFSAGLVGMAVGALFLSPLADTFGRRRAVLGALVILCVGMLASALASSALQLWFLRFLTGLGIGAMLSTINTLLAEWAPPRYRTLFIGLMSLGYPLGAAAGALIAQHLLAIYTWHAIYLLGGFIALVYIVLVWAFLPESLEYLSSRHGAASLGQINALRQRLGAPAIAELPQRTAAADKSGWRELVTRQGLRDTLSICAAFFATMITVFFAQSWTPKLLVNMGFTDSAGLSGSMIMNIAGAVGCVSVGYLAAHFPLKPIAIGMFLCFGVCVAALGVVPAEPTAIFLVLALIGFCLFGSIAVLYALVPTVFSPSCRATGTGLALGLGRLGAIAGPFLAGILIQAGWSRLEFCLLLSLPLLASVIFVWILGRRPAVEALPMPSATH